MAPNKYSVGQKVRVKAADSQSPSARDADIQPYAGQVGEIREFYWLSPRAGDFFYIYTVRIDAERKEIILHEDEIEPCLA